MWVKTKEITIQEKESIAAFHFAQPSPARRDCLELAHHMQRKLRLNRLRGAQAHLLLWNNHSFGHVYTQHTLNKRSETLWCRVKSHIHTQWGKCPPPQSSEFLINELDLL